MAENKKWQLELAEYIRQGEPNQIEKSNAWNIAIGLQDVDGLQISDYLLETAREHFANNSWYFRNALVRANYNDFTKGIHATTEYLVQFFENLLMGRKYELRNRYLHVDYQAENSVEKMQSATEDISKCKNCTLNCTLEELALLRTVKDNPSMTQKQLSEKIGKSERTIKNYTAKLQQKGYLKRMNGKRDGKWEVLVEVP